MICDEIPRGIESRVRDNELRSYSIFCRQPTRLRAAKWQKSPCRPTVRYTGWVKTANAISFFFDNFAKYTPFYSHFSVSSLQQEIYCGQTKCYNFTSFILFFVLHMSVTLYKTISNTYPNNETVTMAWLYAAFQIKSYLFCLNLHIQWTWWVTPKHLWSLSYQLNCLSEISR